ncbi:MAG: NADH-quinone oxidoreductase subunit L [Candidatus Omnitrophota bacterium]|jgi:proton-translocating NADH-quinone oxidoreductase chain N
MDTNSLLLAAVFIPTLLAFILPLAGKLSEKLRNYLALLLVAAPLAASLALIPAVLKGGSFTLSRQLGLGINFVFTADALALFVACVSSFISAIIVIYSFSYISHYENRNEYYFFVVLFLGAMMGLIYTGNLIFLYIFWEITAISSWRLIGFFREKYQVERADKAFLVTVFGALCMLLGFICLYRETGSFDLLVIKEVVKTHPISNLTIGLILAGILSKSATLPFHTWLPDAGVAPSPVTALLHAAVLVKIGVYVFARIFVATIPLGIDWQVVVPIIAGISALVAAGAALIETDLKRIIAYSTISQIGFIFLGFAIGGEVGIAGSLLFILMHGLGKAGLFLCAGIVEQKTHTKDITKLGGLISSMPLTAISFLFCAFSIMGIPPFGGFFSKYMVMAEAFRSGHLVIASMFLLCAFLTILYLFRVFNAVFLGPAKGALVKEGEPVMVGSVLTLATFSLVSGFLIWYPNAFAQVAAISMMGLAK